MTPPARLSAPKSVRWVGSSRDDLRLFPEDVRNRVGAALWEAQLGRKAAYAKPLKGFGGAAVLEGSTTMTGTPIVPYIPCVSRVLCAFSTPFRRSRSVGARRRGRRLF